MSAASRIAGLAIVASLGGCYESHVPELSSDGTCVPLDLGLDCVAPTSARPEGVCRMHDGQVVAFSRRGMSECGESIREPGVFQLLHCGPDPSPAPPITAIRCPGAPESGSLTFVDDRSRTATFDPPRGGCELLAREEPAGPFRPFDEASELCVERPASCGAPTPIEIRLTDGDPCNGRAFAERCDVEIDGARIVLRAEIAPARIDACEHALGDHVARCVVRPLAEGTYEIALPDGRVVDELVITRRAAAPPVERRCVPIPR